MAVNRIDNEIKLRIISDYELGWGCTFLSRKYGIGETSVLRILKANNIQLRGGSEARRTYPINENYFDIIDSIDKAYFLGLLYADGNNYMGKFNCVHLGLHIEDGYLVDTLARLLYKTHKTPYISRTLNPKHTDQRRLRIYNKHISECLCSLGCTPAKSLTLEFPAFLDINLISHFIRGHFDGDGSIFRDNNGNWRVGIVSSKPFCLKLREVIYQLSHSILDYKEVNSSKNGYLFSARKADIKKFLDFIYKHSSEDYRMARKYRLYLDFLDNYEHSRSRWSEEEINTLTENINLPTRKLKLLLVGRSNDAIERKKSKVKKNIKEQTCRNILVLK